MLKKLATLKYTGARLPVVANRTSSKDKVCDMLETELLLAAIPRVAGRHPSHIALTFHVIGNKTMCLGYLC